MKREDLKKVIKLTSEWKVDRRKGNYKLPSGARIDTYLDELTTEFLEGMKLAIASDGNVHHCPDQGKFNTKYFIHIPFKEIEKTDYLEQSERITKFVEEMLY